SRPARPAAPFWPGCSSPPISPPGCRACRSPPSPRRWRWWPPSRYGRPSWLGIGVAVGGAVLLTGVDVALSARALLGDLLALAGGALAAAYVTIGGEVRQSVSTTLYTSICYSTAALVLGLLCLGGRQSLAGFDGRTWLCLLALTAGPQFLGHSVVNRVLRTTSATIVSVAILFEIVGSSLIAWAAFGETPP